MPADASTLPYAEPVPEPSWATTFLPLVVAVAVAITVHLLGPMLGDYGQRILMDISVAVIAAVSLNIVNGFTGQFSLGHAAFMAIGGYTASWLTYYGSLWWWGDTTVPNVMLSMPHLLMIGSAIVGGLVAAAAGWVVGLPSLRLQGDYLAIVTLGFGEILRVLIQQTQQQVWSAQELHERSIGSLLFPPAVGGSLGFSNLPKTSNLFVAYLFVAITLLVAYRIKQSSYGRAMISVRENDIAAEAMGVNVTKLKVRAFMVAAFFAGVAGAIYAHQPGTTLRPIDAGFIRSIEFVLIVVLGGLGSISGAAIAAVLITLLNAWLLKYGEYRMIIFSLALILTMIFRPQGLLGLREIWDLFSRRRGGNT